MYMYTIGSGYGLKTLGMENVKTLQNGSAERCSIFEINHPCTIRVNHGYGTKFIRKEDIVSIIINGQELVPYPASNNDSRWAIKSDSRIGLYERPQGMMEVEGIEFDRPYKKEYQVKRLVWQWGPCRLDITLEDDDNTVISI